MRHNTSGVEMFALIFCVNWRGLDAEAVVKFDVHGTKEEMWPFGPLTVFSTE